MRTWRRSMSMTMAVILGLSLGVSGCVTTTADVADPSPTVRAQMPTGPAGVPAAPPYRTTYTYVPADGAPNATSIGKLPAGPSNGALGMPVAGTLSGPRTTLG